jgi:hypothetical protein
MQCLLGLQHFFWLDLTPFCQGYISIWIFIGKLFVQLVGEEFGCACLLDIWIIMSSAIGSELQSAE